MSPALKAAILARLYEQNAPQEEILRRIGPHVRRWKQWALSGKWTGAFVVDLTLTLSDPVQYASHAALLAHRLGGVGYTPVRGFGAVDIVAQRGARCVASASHQ